MLLQEHWLHECNVSKIQALSDEYFVYGSSAMSDDVILHGRPFGGVAILWHKSIAGVVKLGRKHSRFNCITLQQENGDKILVLNAYLPCDNYKNDCVSEELVNVLLDIEDVLFNCDAHSVILGGDLNTDFNRRNAHTRYLEEFMDRNNLSKCHIGTTHDHITYIDLQSNCQSSIDHFLVSKQLKRNVSDYCVTDLISVNPSNHQPVKLSINTVVECLQSEPRVTNASNISWCRIKANNVAHYIQLLGSKLDTIQCNDAILCKDTRCQNKDHHDALSAYCKDIVESCIDAGNQAFPSVKPRGKCRPFWNEKVKDAKRNSIFWGNIWRECGRPQTGVIADLMRKTRKEYHLDWQRHLT